MDELCDSIRVRGPLEVFGSRIRAQTRGPGSAGVHVIHLNNEPESRTDLADRLETAGCEVDRAGKDWLREGDFTLD